QGRDVACGVVDSRARVLEQTMPLHFHSDETSRSKERVQRRGIPETRAADVAQAGAALGTGQSRPRPDLIENAEILVVSNAGGRAEPGLEAHLVSALEGGYSLGLFRRQCRQLAGSRLAIGATPPAPGFGNAVPTPVPQR